jgi:hypothetical protein
VTFLVDAASKLSEALKLHPDVLDYVVSLNPNDFTRLYHPLMRKLMPPRITLGRVAIMTHTPVFTLLRDIHDIAQHPLTESDCALLADRLGDVAPNLPANAEAPPAWMQHPVLEVVGSPGARRPSRRGPHATHFQGAQTCRARWSRSRQTHVGATAAL